jgi:hypothetical protein
MSFMAVLNQFFLCPLEKSGIAASKVEKLEEKLKKMDARGAKREGRSPSPGGEQPVDNEAVDALDERLGRVEEDCEGFEAVVETVEARNRPRAAIIMIP